MTITAHAIRRYKQRIGKRTASRRRIITQINRDLERDVQYRKPSKVRGHYILVTSKYQAVCFKQKVVTITSLNDDVTNYDYQAEEKKVVDIFV